jgi:hypothetical protein
MIQALFSNVSSLGQRAWAVFHRTDPLAADAAARRERWKQVIAEHQKPPAQPKSTPTAPTSPTGDV